MRTISWVSWVSYIFMSIMSIMPTMLSVLENIWYSSDTRLILIWYSIDTHDTSVRIKSIRWVSDEYQTSIRRMILSIRRISLILVWYSTINRGQLPPMGCRVSDEYQTSIRLIRRILRIIRRNIRLILVWYSSDTLDTDAGIMRINGVSDEYQTSIRCFPIQKAW